MRTVFIMCVKLSKNRNTVVVVVFNYLLRCVDAPFPRGPLLEGSR